MTPLSTPEPILPPMEVSDVLKRARDTYVRELEKPEGVKMLLIGHAVHLMAAAKGDLELVNKALSYLQSPMERFDQAIALAKRAEGDRVAQAELK